MGIISKTAKVKLWGKNIKPLLAFGYNGKKGDIVNVNIEHLNKDSCALIEVQCDYCGRIKTITFSHYNKCKHSNNLYACTHCVGHKVVETSLERYGVPSTTMLQEVKDKMTSTNMERYGGIAPAQSPEVREKITQTLYANSSQKASRQQRYINNLYKGILNYPVKHYNVDIYLPDDDLTIEYDGEYVKREN